MLFQPKYRESGYVVPFLWTLVCVALAAGGYVVVYRGLKRENARRRKLVEMGRDGEEGTEYTVLRKVIRFLGRVRWGRRVGGWLEDAVDAGREGDEKATFMYGL